MESLGYFFFGVAAMGIASIVLGAITNAMARRYHRDDVGGRIVGRRFNGQGKSVNGSGRRSGRIHHSNPAG
jgi:hypothetical protein